MTDPGPALTADDLVRLTGGRLLTRSDRPVRGGSVDSRAVRPGNLFVALPGERTDGHDHLARRGRRRRRRAARHPPARGPGGARRRDRDPRRRRHRRARRGRGRLASPVRPARGRDHRQHRQDLDQGGGRGGPRPTRFRTLRSAGQPEQRDRPAADAPRARSRARGGRPRDGDVRRRRDRRPGRDGAAVDRRRDRGPAGPPVADREHRGHRGGQGRAPRGAAGGRHGDPQRRRPDRAPDGGADRRPVADLRLRRGRRRRGRGGDVRRHGGDAVHASRRRRAPTRHDALARPAVGPQRAGRGRRRDRGRRPARRDRRGSRPPAGRRRIG